MTHDQFPKEHDRQLMQENKIPLNVIVGPQLKAGEGKINAPGMESDHAAEKVAGHALEYMKPVGENPKCGCIDGRLCTHRMDGQLRSEEDELRLSVAGGILATTYAAFELLGVPVSGSTSEKRVISVNKFLESCDIESAGHCDVANKDKNFSNGTGCGAIDKMPMILQNVHKYEEGIRGLIEVVKNPKNTTGSKTQTSFTAADKLLSRHKDWKPQAAIGNMRMGNVEVLKSEENDTHGHAELVVIFNDEPNTTLDRDALYESGYQAFDVDVWYLRKVAKDFAEKLDMPDITEQTMLDAMLAYQLATYLTLCDGSQRPIFIMDLQKDYNLVV